MKIAEPLGAGLIWLVVLGSQWRGELVDGMRASNLTIRTWDAKFSLSSDFGQGRQWDGVGRQSSLGANQEVPSRGTKARPPEFRAATSQLYDHKLVIQPLCASVVYSIKWE